jgi:hypothetical protein
MPSVSLLEKSPTVDGTADPFVGLILRVISMIMTMDFL